MATRSEPSAAAPVEAAASVEDAPVSEDVSAEEAAGVVDAELPQAASMLASSAVLSAAQANFFHNSFPLLHWRSHSAAPLIVLGLNPRPQAVKTHNVTA